MVYQVQVGKGKGAYKTRWVFTGETQAWHYYSCLNIGNGYKKRLLRGSQVVARYAS